MADEQRSIAHDKRWLLVNRSAAYGAADLAQDHTSGDPASTIVWLLYRLAWLEEDFPLTGKSI